MPRLRKLSDHFRTELGLTPSFAPTEEAGIPE